MENERWQRIKDLYLRALHLAPAARHDFVERECGDDAALAAEVLSLIATESSDRDVIGDIVIRAAGDGAGTAGERIGCYRLVRSIGRGGMGEVFLAERADEEFEQRVAIKIVSWARLSSTLVERFRQERQILANLDHPNIARLLDGGTTADGVPYLVMEYVDGKPIVDVAPPMPIADRLALFLKICDAVQYAHSKLVVHRDLKPSNVLVTRDGTPKLLDFGIAKFLDAEAGEGLTRADARILTPEYASPEQVLGLPVTIATDVYGLGLMLYQLLSGELPYDIGKHTSAPDVRELICNIEPEAPSRRAQAQGQDELASRLRGDLDNIVLMALRKEPERRYETVRDLSNDIRNHLERRPVRARAPSIGYLAGRFISRNRVGVTATVAAILAALAMTAFYTNRLHAERDLAETERRTAEAATDFMVDLFTINDPGSGAGREITAREVLETGAEKLEQELEDSPRIRARLMQTLGRVYDRLGDYDSAQRFLEAGVALGRAVVDPLDEHLIRGIEELAWVYYRREDWERASQLAAEALAKREQKVGRNDPSLAEVLNHLGTITFWQDELEASLAYYHRALALLEGDDEYSVKMRLTTINNLAVAYDYMGRNDEAERYYRESLETRIDLYGQDHPRVATAHGNLGTLYLNLEQWAKAKEHAKQALAIDRRHLGDNHADVAFDLNLLAGAERGLGNYEAAAEHANAAVEVWANTVGREHTRYADALDTKATILRESGAFEEALAPASEALDVMLAANGRHHSSTADAYLTKAHVMLGLERLDEARELALEASRIREQVLGRSHFAFWSAELALAQIEVERGDSAPAGARLHRLIGDIETSEAPDREKLETAHALLARATAGNAGPDQGK